MFSETSYYIQKLDSLPTMQPSSNPAATPTTPNTSTSTASTAITTPEEPRQKADKSNRETLYPLGTLIADIEFAVRQLNYVQLTQLGNALGEVLSITRNFLHTERMAHLPFSYTALRDLPSEPEIERFILYCQDLSGVTDSLSATAFKAGFEQKQKIQPLVDAIKTMLYITNQLWLLFEEERWRHRQKRVASLEKLEVVLLRLRECIVDALLTPKNVLEKRQERVETPRMSIRKGDRFRFEKELKDPESPMKILFELQNEAKEDNNDSDDNMGETPRRRSGYSDSVVERSLVYE